MNLASKLLMSLKKRSGHVVLRRELSSLGSPSHVGAAIRNLIAKGRLVRLGSGIYAKTSPNAHGGPKLDVDSDVLLREVFDKLGVKAFEVTVQQQSGCSICIVNVGESRVSRELGWGDTKVRYVRKHIKSKGMETFCIPEDLTKLPVQGVAQFVARFAKAHYIEYRRSGLDDFAEAVTRAAGDDIKLDITGKLLVALKKKNLINGHQFARLLTNHQKELNCVRSVRGLRDQRLSPQY
jgi:hypothetical protein